MTEWLDEHALRAYGEFTNFQTMGHNFVPSQSWTRLPQEMSSLPNNGDSATIGPRDIAIQSLIIDFPHRQIGIALPFLSSERTLESVIGGMQPDAEPSQFSIDFLPQKLLAALQWDRRQVT